MRKFLVKLMNLIYVAGAGISLYALCTRPILKATVTVKFSKEKMGQIVGKAFNNGSESSEEGEEEVRLIYRDSPKIQDYITEEKIETYFPNGFELSIPVEIPAKSAFQLNNTHLLDDLIYNNLYTVVDKVIEKVVAPLESLFKDIVKGFAFDTLKEEINKQIAEKFPDSELASDEEVQEIFDDVYSLLDGDEPVTVDTLAETILHGGENSNGVLDLINSRGRKYVLCEHSEELAVAVEADREATGDEQKYFLQYFVYTHNTDAYNSEVAYFEKTGEDTYSLLDPQPTEEQVEADREAEEASWTYFVAKKQYKHNTDAYDEHVEYYEAKPYTSEDIDEDKITDEMINSLEGVDGLVTLVADGAWDPQPTQEQVEADIALEKQSDRVYYILDGNGDPVLPTAYDSSATYYKVKKIVNDVDTALNTLINGFLNGNSSNSGDNRAIVREEAQEAPSEEEANDLTSTLRDYLYNLIPQNISEKSGQVGEKAPYILLAVIALFALPWAWFILVTLLRTLRKRKCWTRLGIIIWGALLQVILGILLTYGTKYLWPYIAERVEALKDYANSINFDLRTGCLIPSFIWLGFAITAIPYWLLRRPLKYQAKQYKIYEEKARYQRKRERYLNSTEH